MSIRFQSSLQIFWTLPCTLSAGRTFIDICQEVSYKKLDIVEYINACSFCRSPPLLSSSQPVIVMLNRIKSCTHPFLPFFIICILLTSCSESGSPPFSCDDPLGCVNIGPEAPIQIGVLQALTGSVAPLGQAQIRGLELALAERESQVSGHPIALQIEDTGCTTEGGANAALKIIADPQTVAIFGTTCSGAAATASKAMSAAGLTMISGNNSAPFLTSIAGKPAPNWYPGYFRTAPNEENAGKVAAEFAFQQLGIQKAAAIHDNDIYTKGLTSSFSKAFTELGGKIVLLTAINKGDTEMEPVLSAVARSGAQLLFFPLFQPEGNYMLFQARKMRIFDKIQLMSDGALIEASFIKEVGEAGRGMYFVGPTRPVGVTVEQLSLTYEVKFKQKPTVSYYLSGYDASKLLFNAIEQVAIRDQKGTLHIGRQALRDTLYATLAFKGVTGNLSCNQFGDCAKASFNVLRLDDPSLGVNGLESNVVYQSTSE